jgi:hypothetical protein
MYEWLNTHHFKYYSSNPIFKLRITETRRVLTFSFSTAGRRFRCEASMVGMSGAIPTPPVSAYT